MPMMITTRSIHAQRLEHTLSSMIFVDECKESLKKERVRKNYIMGNNNSPSNNAK
jgi:hypothetical protein